jgi:hypothetical protein
MDGPPGILRIHNPDQPIYRIFSLWFFEAALRVQQLVLVSPHKWEDPYEALPYSTMLTDLRGKPQQQIPLGRYLHAAWAQCWSQTKESDTLLRAYSRVMKDPHHNRNTTPRDEGVRVRSTPRKLLSAMQIRAKSMPMSCFVGAVRYQPGDAIRQELVNIIERKGPSAVGRGQLRAESLLLKRDAFSHEVEVRIICVADELTSNLDTIQIPIDPSEVFEEVTFDPRLELFERYEREQTARTLGYRGSFGISELYQGVLLDLGFPNGWKED